jgi:hypothetical protein
VADETLAVLCGPLLQIVDEGFDQVPFGLLQDRGSAVISRIGLDEIGVELVLADEQAETVAKTMLSVVVTVISGRDRIVLFGSDGICRARGPTELLDRTEADAIGLAEGAVDGTSFGHAHLSATDQGRNVRGIGIAIANEAARARGLVGSRFENPVARTWITELAHRAHLNASTSIPPSQAHKATVRDIPSTIEKLQVSECN